MTDFIEEHIFSIICLSAILILAIDHFLSMHKRRKL